MKTSFLYFIVLLVKSDRNRHQKMSPGKPNPSLCPFKKPYLEWSYRRVFCAVYALGIGVSKSGKQRLDPRDGKVKEYLLTFTSLCKIAYMLMKMGSALLAG